MSPMALSLIMSIRRKKSPLKLVSLIEPALYAAAGLVPG
jgi:hypothetical protein